MKKNLLKGGIALLLTFCLLFGTVGSALAATVTQDKPAPVLTDDGGGKISYVAIGDSYANGYGLEGYVREKDGKWVRGYGDGASPRAYPGVIAQALDAELTNLTVSGMRTGEFRYLVDPDYAGDDYTGEFIAENIFDDIAVYAGGEDWEDLSAQFADAIAGADLITFGLGVNDFGTYLSQRLTDAVGITSYGYYDNLADILDELPDGEVKDRALEIYNEVIAALSEKAPVFAVSLANAFAYAYGAFVLNFAADMQIIRQLNPDAQIIVLSIPNQMKGITLNGIQDLADALELPENVVSLLPDSIDIGGLYGEVITSANVYMAGYLTGTFDQNCAYVDIDGFEIIYEALAQGIVERDPKKPQDQWKFKPADGEYNNLSEPDYETISQFTMNGLAGMIRDQLATRLGGISDGQFEITNYGRGELKTAIPVSEQLTCTKTYGDNLIAITGGNAAYVLDEDTDASVADIIAFLEATKAAYEQASQDTSQIEENINNLYMFAGVSNILWSLSAPNRIMDAFNGKGPGRDVIYNLGGQSISHNVLAAQLYTGLLLTLQKSMAANPVDGTTINGEEIAGLIVLIDLLMQSLDPSGGGLLGAGSDDPQEDDPLKELGIDINDLPGSLAKRIVGDPEAEGSSGVIPAALALYTRYLMAEGVGNHPTPAGYEFMAEKILEAVEDPEAHKPSDEVAKAVAELMQVIGDAAWNYAEDVGIVDAVNDLYDTVRDQAILPAIEQIKQTSAAAAQDLDDATKDVQAAVADVIGAMQDVADALAAIESYDDTMDGDELAAAEQRLTDLFQTLNDKLQTLEKAVDNLDEVYQKYRDEVSNAYDDAKANILNGYQEAKAELEARFPAIAQNPNYPEIVQAVDAAVAKATQAVDEGKARALAAIDKAEGEAVAAAKAFLKDLEPYAEQISAAAAVKDPTQYTQMIVEYMQTAKEIYDKVIAAIEFIVNLPETIKETYELMLAFAGFGFYTDTNCSKYVSIGDSTATGYGLDDYWNGFNDGSYGFRATVAGSYPYLIANTLIEGGAASTSSQAGVDARDNGEFAYIQLGCGGLRVDDFRYLLSAEKIPEFNYSVEDGGHLLTDLPDDATVEFLYHELVARAAGNKNAYDESAADHWNTGKFAVEDAIPWTPLADPTSYTVLDSYDIDGLREYYAAELADADLVTVQMGSNNFATFVTGQLADMGVYDFLNGGGYECVDPSKARECQWDNYLDPQTAAYVRMTLDGITNALTLAGLPENLAGAITVLIESYAYGVVGYAYNLPETVNLIHELAPNAVVVVVGMVNTLRDGELDIGRFIEGVNVKIPVGDMLEYFIDLTNAECAYYAIQTPNTVFVPVNDASTFAQSVAETYGLDLMDVYLAGLLGIGDEELKKQVSGNGFSYLMHEDYAGHEYIKTQILDALNVIDAELTLEDGQDLTYTGAALDPKFVLSVGSESFGYDQYDSDSGYFEGPFFYRVEEANDLLTLSAAGGRPSLTPVEEVKDVGTYRAYVFFEDVLNDSIIKSAYAEFEVKEAAPTPPPSGTGGGSVTYRLTLADAVNGTVDFAAAGQKGQKSINVAARTSVRIEVKPAANFMVDTVTYTTQANATPTALLIDADGYYVIEMPSSNTTVTATFKPENDNDPAVGRANIAKFLKNYLNCSKDDNCMLKKFRDLDPKAWYHDGIHFCLENGIMQGFGTPDFLPDGITTRAQVVTTLWNIAGHPIKESAVTFQDVKPEDWFYQAITWAAGNGIVEGYGNGFFGPNDEITHEQMAKIFFGYAKFLGYDVSAKADISKMDGADKVTDWAVPFVEWAVGAGICCGKDGNANSVAAAPEKASRAELATFILDFCVKVAVKLAEQK